VHHRGLGSSPKYGLAGNDSLLRKKKYGANVVKRATSPSFWKLFATAMEDQTVLILLFAAGISISLSIIVCVADLGASCPRKPLWGGPVELVDHDEGPNCSGWMDGACIILACLLVGVITAWNEQAKEAQFRGLQKHLDDCAVTVKRNGEIVRCQAEDVMVGDLVMLETGARVPADGLFLKGSELRCDESALTGEPMEVAKDDDHPFISSGAMVTNGSCVFLVTAVGARSEWGRILAELGTERDETPLQGKLKKLADLIGAAGMLVASLCFVAQLVIWLYDNGRETCFFPPDGHGNLTGPVEDCALGYPGLNDKAACLKKGHVWTTNYANWNWMKLKDLVSFFIDSVTIIVVAVPEGLPLAVTIALAYSVRKMQKDKNLVRVMAACETMGGATNICSDKTGTLTLNVMTVVDGYFTGWACEGGKPPPPPRLCGWVHGHQRHILFSGCGLRVSGFGVGCLEP
jgi:magnesium-transporting ATPase (P-type)